MAGRSDILYWDEAYAINGAAMEVHNLLGCGMHEVVYGDALEVEFRLRGIPSVREKSYTIDYKGSVLRHTFECDFVCYDKIIVEIKAVKELEDMHRSQILNYLHYSKLRLGLLINFGGPRLVSQRFIV